MFLEVSNAGGWCDRGEVVNHLSVNLDFDPECVMAKCKLNAASSYIFRFFSESTIMEMEVS